MARSLKALERPQTLVELVQQNLREYIVDNELRPGDALPSEGDFAKLLSVGRSSIREAVSILESNGLIERRHGSGLFVKSFSLEPLLQALPYNLLESLHELLELQEVRQVLEQAYIQQAIQHSDDSHVARLRQIVISMQARAEKQKRFVHEDREFHQVLLAPVGNTVVLRMLDSFWMALRKANDSVSEDDDSKLTPISRDPLAAVQDHISIVEAVAARDVPAAVAAIGTHYHWLSEHLRRLQQSRGEQA